MNLLPPSNPRFPQALITMLWVLAPIANAEPIQQEIAPSQTRLWLAQANSGTAPAVSSQAVTTQPPSPGRLSLPKTSTNKPVKPAPPVIPQRGLDPLLDPDRPKNCQLQVFAAQTISSQGTEVQLPAGTYRQVKIVEGPQERTAAASVDLKAQAQGLGYIRYLAEEKIKVNGEERSGGIDVGVRPTDGLPIRIWYKKFNPPDDVTKAIGFILPPVMIAAGAGAWSSGNVIFPDKDPVFTEARDYYLRETTTAHDSLPIEEKLKTIKPAEAAKSGSFYIPGSTSRALRSR